jgi:hypothetical protein
MIILFGDRDVEGQPSRPCWVRDGWRVVVVVVVVLMFTAVLLVAGYNLQDAILGASSAGLMAGAVAQRVLWSLGNGQPAV